MMPREILTIILLILLIICAVAVNIIPNLLQSVVIFMAYSSIMSVVWILMESPDLGITEAAVGAGVSGIMFLMTLKKVREEDEKDPADLAEEKKQMMAELAQHNSAAGQMDSGAVKSDKKPEKTGMESVKAQQDPVKTSERSAKEAQS